MTSRAIYFIVPSGKPRSGENLLHEIAHAARGVGMPVFQAPQLSGSRAAVSTKVDEMVLPIASVSDIGPTDSVVLANRFAYLIPTLNAQRVSILWLRPEDYFDSLRLWQEFDQAIPTPRPKFTEMADADRPKIQHLVKDEATRALLLKVGLANPIVLPDPSDRNYSDRLAAIFFEPSEPTQPSVDGA